MSITQLEMLLDDVEIDTGLVRLVWRDEDFAEDGDFYLQKEFRLMPGRSPGDTEEE